MLGELTHSLHAVRFRTVWHLGSSWFLNQSQELQEHSLHGREKGRASGPLSHALASGSFQGSYALVPTDHPDLSCALTCIVPKPSWVWGTHVTIPDTHTHTHVSIYSHICSPHVHTLTHVHTGACMALLTLGSHETETLPPTSFLRDFVTKRWARDIYPKQAQVLHLVKPQSSPHQPPPWTSLSSLFASVFWDQVKAAMNNS